MPAYRDQVAEGVSAVASSGLGVVTLSGTGSAVGDGTTGRTFAAALAADTSPITVRLVEGTAWEVFDSAYTHSGTTLSRGTLRASSTGSRVAFTSAAKAVLVADARALQWATQGSTPQVVALSSMGILSDADLSQGSSSFGTDQTTKVQAVLNLATASLPLKVLWDVRCSVTGLVMKTHTAIEALPGCGAILRTGSNRTLIENENFVWTGTRTDKKQSIRGGVWNGNAGASNANNIKGNGTVGLVCVFRFYGVEGLDLFPDEVLAAPSYAIHAINCKDYNAGNALLDCGPSGVINNDGIHADAGCEDVVFRDLVINSHDDGVAFNADDLFRDPGNFTYPYYPTTVAGPIKNVSVDGVIFKSQLFGVRVLSGASRIDNILLRNLKGYTNGYAVIIDNYLQAPSSLYQAGSGNIGTVEIDGLDVDVYAAASDVNVSIINVNCNIERLIIRNLRRKDFTLNCPTLWITGAGTVVQDLIIEGYDAADTTSSFDIPHILVTGATVQRMKVSRATVKRTGTANASALVRTASSATIGTLQLDHISLDKMGDVVDNASGAITRIVASNIVQTNSVSGATGFSTASTVPKLTLSNYDGATSPTSGTFTVTAGDAFVAVPDTTAPTVTSVAVENATPTVVDIQMGETMDTGYVPAAAAFTVSGHTVSSVAIVGSVISLTVSAAFVNGEAARTVAYTQPGTNNARDVAGNLLANFSGQAITNNVGSISIGFTNADGFLVNTAGVLTLGSGTGTTYRLYKGASSTAKLPSGVSGSVAFRCDPSAAACHDSVIGFATTSGATGLPNVFAGATFFSSSVGAVENGALSGSVLATAVANSYYRVRRDGSTGAIVLEGATTLSGTWTAIGTLAVTSTADLYVVCMLYTSGVLSYPTGVGLTA
jgi:hypothetical protein